MLAGRAGSVGLLVGALLLAGCGSGESRPSRQLEAEERTTEQLKDPGTQGASAESEGEAGTPCHAEYSLTGGTLAVTVSSEEEGDVVVKPLIDGRYRRAEVVDSIDSAGAIPTVVFAHVGSLERLPTTLQTPSGDVHLCSVVPAG